MPSTRRPLSAVRDCRCCQFKRDGNGTWMFGQKRTVVEDGSRWAVNPATFKRGWICFSNDNKVVGEQLLSVSQPMPEVTELPDNGFPWQQQWAVNLKCIGGTDAGTEVIYKPHDRRRHPGRRGYDRGGT